MKCGIIFKKEMWCVMKKLISLVLVIALIMVVFNACGKNNNDDTVKQNQSYDGTQILLDDKAVKVNGSEISTDSSQSVYKANDIVYYESGHDFMYGEGAENESHTKEKADSHTVVHITQPGQYILSGKLSKGQVAVDLGEDAESNPESVVTIVFNGADITCEVAPAVIFYNVYECGSKDEESASKDVDTQKAGANVILADGTVNNISGSHVAKIYDPDSVVLSDDGKEVEDAEKLHKYDGAFYSKMSMNISAGEKGDGVLNINADNEGLDSELHLTVNGGNINIVSGNDGINTNEDNISVTTVNAGNVNIMVNGETGEGDGIDSNGWLVINGGSVTAQACAFSGDAGIDSDKGIHINGGKVFATGNMLDRISQSEQTFAVFSFTQSQKSGTYTLKDADKKTVAENKVTNDFKYLIVSSPELKDGEYTLWKGETPIEVMPAQWNGGADFGTVPPQADGEAPVKPEGDLPENMLPPEGEEMPGRPEGVTPPEKPDNMTPPDGNKPDGMRPDNKNDFGAAGEKTEILNIKSGENYFTA